MEAALLLLVFVFVELGLTIWLAARHREYLRRVKRVEDRLDHVASEKDVSKASDFELVKVEGATDEDMAQASALLDAIMKASKNG